MKKTFCMFAVILLISLCMAACSSNEAQKNVQEDTTGENMAEGDTTGEKPEKHIFADE